MSKTVRMTSKTPFCPGGRHVLPFLDIAAWGAPRRGWWGGGVDRLGGSLEKNVVSLILMAVLRRLAPRKRWRREWLLLPWERLPLLNTRTSSPQFIGMTASMVWVGR